eukprot:3706301-Pyramimonas_sp.AAC.1
MNPFLHLAAKTLPCREPSVVYTRRKCVRSTRLPEKLAPNRFVNTPGAPAGFYDQSSSRRCLGPVRVARGRLALRPDQGENVKVPNLVQ